MTLRTNSSSQFLETDISPASPAKTRPSLPKFGNGPLLLPDPSNQYFESYADQELDENEGGDDHSTMSSSSLVPPIQPFRFKKLLCANRGEIAIRVFRAAFELGMCTVAIFSHEDHLAQHRYKADEAYEIMGDYTPVGAYLAMDAILAIAKRVGVDVIHPGYGFLSENPEFARRVRNAGIAYVGPPADIIAKMGDKTAARQVAIECEVPVVPGTNAVRNLEQAEEFVKTCGLPVILKAAMGGGGRGMRVVKTNSELAEQYARATSEALNAFGDGTIFIERFIPKARHIEVQLLADEHGNVIHLFERDCSVQRRHQKVVEAAPALYLSDDLRRKILDDAVRIARFVGYQNAGTAEFLVDQESRYYFIEVNPRIQVEHTVTEEITGVDLIAAQIYITAGTSLPMLGLHQDRILPRGHAIQCRVTTEDPMQNFQPDCGKIEVYRSAGGFGIRLDGGAGYQGNIITPHYDSLLVKVTAKGATYRQAIQRLLRGLSEFRIRGVRTNIPFLLQLLMHPIFQKGAVWTTFIDDTPSLFEHRLSQNRAQKLLYYLGELVVNGSQIQGQIGKPGKLVPQLPILDGMNTEDIVIPCEQGWRAIYLKNGPEGVIEAILSQKRCLLTDTTWRDAHQSLLMTRMRTHDISRVATVSSHAFKDLFSFEMWGGATFDVAMRFLYECPWERLKILRRQCPNVLFQMLLRGANAVGYTNYPDNVVFEFVKKAKELGIDVFRVFDSLNYMENLKIGIDAVKAAGGIVEGAICYTGDVSSEFERKYTLDYYLRMVEELVLYGIHILGIKDMAGLLRPQAARILVTAIRQRFPNLPIHMHTHDTAGTGVASMLEAAKSGANIIDVAVDSMSGLTSQPSMGALIASLEGTSLDTGINFTHMQQINSYWEQVRLLYACFETGVKSGSSEVYIHQMPGGQYTNLQFQAQSLGLGSEWQKIKSAYTTANLICGDIIKVTPSSKVVGDLAQFLVQNNLTEDEVYSRANSLSFPTSVVEYFQGLIGQPVGGFREPLRSRIIKELPKIDHRPGLSLPPLDLVKLQATLTKKYDQELKDVDVLSAALYPKVFEEYMVALKSYGDLSILPTRYFLEPLEIGEEFSVEIEAGKTLFIKLLAVGPIDPITGRREVYFELNGEARVLTVTDKLSPIDKKQRLKADPSNPGEVGAPMSGVVVEIRLKVGSIVKTGDPICILNAMKMETVVSAPVDGRIQEIFVKQNDSISAADLIAKISK